MAFLPILGGALSVFGALQNYGQDQSAYNSANAAAGQDAAAQNQLFQSIENTLGTAWGNYSPYLLNEAKHGMDPAVRAAAMNSYNISNTRDLASIKNELGGVLPNLSGTLEDMRNQELQGGLQLQGQLSAQDQAIRDRAMSEYFGGAMGMTQPLMQIAGQYGQAGQAAQQNAWGAMQGMQQNNPFSAVGNFLSSGAMSGANLSHLFGGGQPQAPPWGYINPGGYTQPVNAPPPQQIPMNW
jgi:hypothetical protein